MDTHTTDVGYEELIIWKFQLYDLVAYLRKSEGVQEVQTLSNYRPKTMLIPYKKYTGL